MSEHVTHQGRKAEVVNNTGYTLLEQVKIRIVDTNECLVVLEKDLKKGWDNTMKSASVLPVQNWWGEQAHPSDELVHWREVSSPRIGSFSPKLRSDFKKSNTQLRADWDLLNSTPELAAAFQRMKSAIYEKVRNDQAENEAGESI